MSTPKKETAHCDNCGEPGASWHFSELPLSVASANAGESGTLCKCCAACMLPHEGKGQGE
jgi:hypothetical protein